jgi:hypothetical protein
LQSKVLLYTANIFQSALFRERHVQNARIIWYLWLDLWYLNRGLGSKTDIVKVDETLGKDTSSISPYTDLK